MKDIEPFLVPEGAVSPGGKAAIGIRVDGQVIAWCIGSGENLRDAKAAALRNIRIVLSRLRSLDPDWRE
jgi:hypothetical protein